MTDPKSRSQERRMEAQRGYGDMAAEAARRIKDKNAWSEVNAKRPLNIPEIAIIIQDVADKNY